MSNMKKAVLALNRSKLFSTIADGLGYERIGLEILCDDKVVDSFTSYNVKGKITRVAQGLDRVAFVTQMSEQTFEEITDPTEVAWMEEHPVQAIRKYLNKMKMPLSIKLRIGKLFLKGLLK